MKTTTPEIEFLGDVHLGKKFITGVPLHRKGDRERMVQDDFLNQLCNTKADMHVQVGDLFDTFAVEEAIVLFASSSYKHAAKRNPNTTYIIVRGNHDASRDTTKSSSFDVFAELMMGVDNVIVLNDVCQFNGYGFIPWHPFKSSTELAYELTKDYKDLKAVIGHWDVQSFGGDDFNLVPTNVLCHVTKTIYTGHIHLPSVFERDGVTVNVVGSMQPYSHAEDANGRWYTTLPVEQFLTEDHALFEDYNVRVLVKEPTDLPQIDCLSLITKKVAEGEEVLENDMDVAFDAFDMQSLFQDVLQGVGKDVARKILDKYEELKNA